MSKNDKKLTLKDIANKVDLAAAAAVAVTLDVGIKTGIIATASLGVYAGVGMIEAIDMIQLTQDQFMDKAANIIHYIDAVSAETKGMTAIDGQIHRIADLATNKDVPLAAPKLKALGETLFYGSPVIAAVTVAVNKLHDAMTNAYDKPEPPRRRM